MQVEIKVPQLPESVTEGTLGDWLKKVGVQPMQIYPGSPWENGYNERFNGTLRREVLNAEWFHSTGRRKRMTELSL